MTSPITPVSAIHNVPANDSGAFTVLDAQQLEAWGRQIITAIVREVVLALFGTVGTQDLQLLQQQLHTFQLGISQTEGDLQTLITDVGSGNIAGVVSTILGLTGDIGTLITDVGVATIADVAAAINTALTSANHILDSIATALGVPDAIPYLNAFFGDVEGVVNDINRLVSAVGTTWDDFLSLVSRIVNALEKLGSSFPKIFPSIFGSGDGTTLSDLVPLTQFQQLLDGIVGNGTEGNTVHDAIGALRDTHQEIHSDISQAIQDGVAGVEGAGAAITQSLQAFPGQNVISGVASVGSTIVNDVRGVIDGGIGALNPSLSGNVGGTIQDWESALSAHLTGLFNGWTGASVTKAGAADISAAAVSAAEQAASLAHQTAAIQSELPHFYGGAGASGIGIEVGFSGGVPQGAGNAFTAINAAQYQYSGTNGYGGTAATQTDSETVAGIWSTIIPANTFRGIYLRGNAAGTTKVWALWLVVGDPGAQANGGYYIPNDTAAYFQLYIGCDVAGTSTTLHTFGPFPLWAFAGNVIITSYTLVETGPWWQKNEYWQPNYGPGWSALAGYSMYLNSGNNVISLEATADTFALAYPGANLPNVIDTTPVSLMGSAYRQAGFYDFAGVPGSQVSWAFWDSGPTAGPQREPIATAESTASTAWTDLATIGPTVTVNVGSSGMVIVVISCACSNTAAASFMGFAASGENTFGSGGANQNLFEGGASGAGGSAFTLLTGLTPGPTTFTAKYLVTGGTGTFSLRDIAAIPL